MKRQESKREDYIPSARRQAIARGDGCKLKMEAEDFGYRNCQEGLWIFWEAKMEAKREVSGESLVGRLENSLEQINLMMPLHSQSHRKKPP
jgi:hypothetical protein